MTNRIILLALLFFASFSSLWGQISPPTNPQTRMLIMGNETYAVDNLDNLKNAVVKFTVTGEENDWSKTGAGVIIGTDAEVDMVFVLTAYHTFIPPDDAESGVGKIEAWFKQKDYFPFSNTRVIDHNEGLDIALIGIFDVSASIRNGFIAMPVIKPEVLGNAFAFGHSSFGDWEYDVTEYRSNYDCNTLQADNQRFRLDEAQSVEPGFSGGPVFMTIGSGDNKQYGLVGIVVSAGQECVNGVYFDAIKNLILTSNPNFTNQLTDGASGLAGGEDSSEPSDNQTDMAGGDPGNSTSPPIPETGTEEPETQEPPAEESREPTSPPSDGKSDVLLIYKDLAFGQPYERVFKGYGYTVEMEPANNSTLTYTDLSNYKLVVIANDAGKSTSWMTNALVSKLLASKKPVLGMGKGGAVLFEKMGLSIKSGHTWTVTSRSGDRSNSIYVESTKMNVFNTPNKVTVPSSRKLKLYRTSWAYSLNKPNVSNKATFIGKELDDQSHYPIVKEMSYTLWGFSGSATNMTTAGKQMLHNVMHDLINPTYQLTGTLVTELKQPLLIATMQLAGLAAPTQVSPSDGAVYNRYPRTTKLTWKSVNGAVSYSVELDCDGCCGRGWCTDNGKSYRIEKNIKDTSYTFNWVGAQKGRWRVWAVDKNGKAGAKSAWRGFDYKK